MKMRSNSDSDHEYNDYQMGYYADAGESKTSKLERNERGARWFKRAEPDPDFELKINRAPIQIEDHEKGENEYQMAHYLGRVFPGMVIEVIERTVSGFISRPLRGLILEDWLTLTTTSPRQVIQFLRNMTIFLHHSGLVHNDLHTGNIYIESPAEFQLFDFETSYLLADPIPLFDIDFLLRGIIGFYEEPDFAIQLKRWIESHSHPSESRWCSNVERVSDFQDAPLEEWYLLLDEVESQHQ